MALHRAETFLHIVATTHMGGLGDKRDEMARAFITDAMELTRNLARPHDNDDATSVTSSIMDLESGQNNAHIYTVVHAVIPLDTAF